MPVDAKDFKAALGRFLSGVTVVACEVEGEVQAMTASAFVSVSLNPPLVLVSVAHSARFHEKARAAGAYGVSILSRDQEAFSSHFAGYPQAVQVEWQRDGFRSPVLAGALAQLDCTLVQVVDAGDHSLFLGRVEGVRVGETSPLGYFRGKYVGVS